MAKQKDKMDYGSEGYLTGQLLVATPVLQGSYFEKTVIYMCVHNADGAMGIVINKLAPNTDSRELVDHFGLEVEKENFSYPVYSGGPVEPGRGFILHSTDYENEGTVEVDGKFSVTSNIDVLEDMATGEGPMDILLALGYAGWSPGQLDSEVENNSWFTVPATNSLVFDADDESKWMLASKSIGINPFMFADHAGHA